MRQRYCRYMNDIRPSDELLSRIEAQMRRELRQKHRRSRIPMRLTAVAAAAAALVLAMIGLKAVQPRIDVISPPTVVSPAVTPSSAPAGGNMALSADPAPATQAAETTVLYRLEMTGETVPEIVTDVNYYYGCYPIQPYEQLSVHADASPDSEIIENLLPGTVFWTDQFTLDGDALRPIRWYDRQTASMKTGWAGRTERFSGDSAFNPLGCPGRVITDGAVMRYGVSINAPEITALAEGQHLFLAYQVYNWVFASTAPFDQTGENPPLPTAGWVYVKDVVGLQFADDAATTPSPAPAASYPPDDVRLELEMSDESVFAVSSIVENQDSIMLFEDNLVGAHNSSIVEICQSSELNSVVIAPLRPGTAYWPHRDAEAGDIVYLTDQKGKEIGYAERVTYLDEETNTLKEGWRHVIHADDPLPEVPDNPVERIQKPGKVKDGGTSLRYGRSADAPIIALLEEGQKLGLGYRVGNWVYASTSPFCADDETPVTGWIHISEVVGMGWRMTINHVELTADEVNLRAAPDGALIYTVSRSDAEAGLLEYGGATVPGKTGDWHFVRVGAGFFKDFTQTGYISAEYSRLYTFRLESELNLDGVVSATLSYSQTSPFGAAEQTVTGDKLDMLLDRLRSAYSESVYTEVCSEGTAAITLNYADGSMVSLPLSGDSCTQVRHGDVTYDLKTDAERTERLLNDGGVGLTDILGPIFDQIKIP